MSKAATYSESTYEARWIFPADRPPIPGGSITISGQRIVAVGKKSDTAATIDLGDVAILPGLVNAHTHLEFSQLPVPLGLPGMPFVDWIRRVIQFRSEAEKGSGPIFRDGPQGASHKLDLTPFLRGNAVAIGLHEAMAGGTTTLGEIAAPSWQPPVSDEAAAMTVFHESIGLADQSIDENERSAGEFLDYAMSSKAEYLCGLSPHAPFSVHPELFARLVDMSARRRVPLAMHLAESPEELQLLSDQTGPFRDFLEERQVWNAAGIWRGTRPLDYLRTLIKARRALVIHGNYLADDELSYLAAHRDRLALVYCPRTHAFFGHPPHPLPRLLAAGGFAAIGTDSRASNPDLDMWAELRFLAESIPELSPQQVLELGTLDGAKALGRHSDTGSLSPGKFADLVVMPLTDATGADAYELLFADETAVARTMFRGRWVEPNDS
jgi:cytosine/adenosine deaminase-related metal-dependent hydrolase